jgi:hypothetical protein
VVTAWSLTYLGGREANRKGFAMLHQLKNLLGTLRVPTTAERELAYLNGSHDRYDLEHRQRQIDAGMFRSRF